MADLSELDQERRPAVRILSSGCTEDELRPILWGLEEEGIPYELQGVTAGDAVSLAKKAAHMSTLNVGLSGHRGANVVVLHHRDLAEGAPLFTLPLGNTNARELRRLGTNAARLVKGDPLIFEDEAATSEPKSMPESPNDDALTEAIVRSVLELLAKG